jgi:hypothetical protein
MKEHVERPRDPISLTHDIEAHWLAVDDTQTALLREVRQTRDETACSLQFCRRRDHGSTPSTTHSTASASVTAVCRSASSQSRPVSLDGMQ